MHVAQHVETDATSMHVVTDATSVEGPASVEGPDIYDRADVSPPRVEAADRATGSVARSVHSEIDATAEGPIVAACVSGSCEGLAASSQPRLDGSASIADTGFESGSDFSEERCTSVPCRCILPCTPRRRTCARARSQRTGTTP
jgi:hypothetical protein